MKTTPVSKMTKKEFGRWISIQADISQHWIWQNPTWFRWWVDLIIGAAWAPTSVILCHQRVAVGVGEQIASLRILQQRWGEVSYRRKKPSYPGIKRIRYFLSLLEKEGMITIDHSQPNRTSRITVVNYPKYQGKMAQLYHEQAKAKRLARSDAKWVKGDYEREASSTEAPLGTDIDIEAEAYSIVYGAWEDYMPGEYESVSSGPVKETEPSQEAKSSASQPSDAPAPSSAPTTAPKQRATVTDPTAAQATGVVLGDPSAWQVAPSPEYHEKVRDLNQARLNEYFTSASPQELNAIAMDLSHENPDTNTVQAFWGLAYAVVSEWNMNCTTHASYEEWARHLIKQVRIKNKSYAKGKISARSGERFLTPDERNRLAYERRHREFMESVIQDLQNPRDEEPMPGDDCW